MTERPNQDRYTRIFRREWEMYASRDRDSASKSARVKIDGDFDVDLQVGDLRIFADHPDALVGLLREQTVQGWVVVPMSPFTVPADEHEILIGPRVYQLWNTFTLDSRRVQRSWLVEQVPAEDVEDVSRAGTGGCPDDLRECMGAPASQDDLQMLASYRLSFRVPTTLTMRPQRRWMRVGFGLAAMIVLGLGITWPLVHEEVRRIDGREEMLTVARSENPQTDCGEPLLEQMSSGTTGNHEQEMDVAAVADETRVSELNAGPEEVRRLSVDAMLNIKSPVAMKCVMGTPRSAGVRGCVRSPCRVAMSIGSERYDEVHEEAFMKTLETPLSTFGLDVDTASYATMRRYLVERDVYPPRESVRLEEYVNYFPYSYAAPTGNVPVALDCELAACPWNTAHQLLRVGVRARRDEKAALPPGNFVFLLDVSGSMEYNGGFRLLKEAMELLIDELRDVDHVSIVTYANDVRLVLPPTNGREKKWLHQVIDTLSCGGGTAGGAGLQLAYDQAQKGFLKDGNNRVILMTDGDFNLGISNPNALRRFIAEKRKTGVFLTVLGVGQGNYQDRTAKVLAKAGNGNYAYLDNLREAEKVLKSEFTESMMTVAKDVKLQLEFNPAQVESYRLLGYEGRKLAAGDFVDDEKDAGEIGAGHTMTALYELVLPIATNAVALADPLKYQKVVPVSSPELLTIKLRYKEPREETSRLLEMPVVAEEITKVGPSADFLFASAVAEYALLLRDSQFKGMASFDAVLERARRAQGEDKGGFRAEFIRLVEKAKRVGRVSDGKRVKPWLDEETEINVDPGCNETFMQHQ